MAADKDSEIGTISAIGPFAAPPHSKYERLHWRLLAWGRSGSLRGACHRRICPLTGLIMFLYGIGILYGRQFFEGMIGAEGRKYNLLALAAVVAGLLVALGLGHVFGIKVGHTLGLFAGSMTSTATLQAALA
jgi:hypothetical protein